MDINDILRAVVQGVQNPPAREGGGFSGKGAPAGEGPAGSLPPVSHRRAPGVSSSQHAAPEPSGDMPGAVLGGPSSGGSGNPASAGADPLSSVLGALLGGSGAPGGGSGDVLGTLLGSRTTDPASNAFLAPLANLLAQRLNVPPDTAAAVVNYAVSKLMAAQAGGGSHGNFTVQSLMEQLNSAGGVGHDFALSTGAAHELSQRTGIDVHTAASALQTVYNELGTRAGPS